jgi:multimeric flavodoxin WrbA
MVTNGIAINGSPRRNGNMSIVMGHIMDELEKGGTTRESVNIAGRVARGCTACMECLEKQNGHCIFNDDINNRCIDKIRTTGQQEEDQDGNRR